ncbi:MAG: sulfite exporter TauE/SafE family protein [Acidobacteria bacterium]|nr:sulfite exporter TauE/SafE family protein [Acidobacteriota bacterium]
MAFVVAGLVTGIVGGLFGIGGAAVLVPLLVYGFGLSQHQAQGTSLFVLLPPIGALAALEYYRAGYVEVRPAMLIAAGFVLGAFLGAAGAVRISPVVLQRGFGLLLVALGLHMVFRR